MMMVMMMMMLKTLISACVISDAVDRFILRPLEPLCLCCNRRTTGADLGLLGVHVPDPYIIKLFQNCHHRCLRNTVLYRNCNNFSGLIWWPLTRIPHGRILLRALSPSSFIIRGISCLRRVRIGPRMCAPSIHVQVAECNLQCCNYWVGWVGQFGTKQFWMKLNIIYSFSSLIACYLVRLDDQCFSSVVEIYEIFFWRGGAKMAQIPLEKCPYAYDSAVCVKWSRNKQRSKGYRRNAEDDGTVMCSSDFSNATNR